jgi:DNA-binding beta-propeller fold protein YncE
MTELANTVSAKKSIAVAVVLALAAAFPVFPEGVRLSVKVFPPGAVLSVDGRPEGPAETAGPVRHYDVPRGFHVLRFQSRGYHPKTVRVDLRDDFFLEEKLERSDSRLVLLGETPTGKMPKSVTFTSDGNSLVVPLLAEKGVDLVPADGLFPRNRIELTPPGSGHRGYVESVLVRSRGEVWVSQMDTGQVHVLREGTWDLLESVDTGGRWSKVIALSADERLAFVSNWLTKNVSVVDVASRGLLRTVPVSGVPRGMAATADGRFLYVCIFDTGNIDKIDLSDFTVKTTLEFGPGAKRHIVLDEKRGRGYVSDMATGRVSCFSLDEDRVVSSVWAGSNLNTLAMSGDGRFLFVSSRGKNNPETYLKKGPDFGKVTVIDAESMKIVDWTWGRNQPTGLAVSPDGRRIAFTDFLDDNLEVYDISGLYGEMPRLTSTR